MNPGASARIITSCASFLLSKQPSVGMSAVCQVPRRAFANPASIIGQLPKASISGASFHSIAKSSSLSRTITARSWNRSLAERKVLAAFGGQRYSTSKLGDPFAAEKESLGNKRQAPKSSQSPRKGIRYLIVLGVLSVGAFTFSDEIKHAYRAAARTGRVVGTLAVCINE